MPITQNTVMAISKDASVKYNIHKIKQVIMNVTPKTNHFSSDSSDLDTSKTT